MTTANKYVERCNDPDTRKRWEESGLVEVQSLRAGDVFECINGRFWRRGRRTSSGPVIIHPWDREGEPDTMISRALVRPVMRKQFVQPEG